MDIHRKKPVCNESLLVGLALAVLAACQSAAMHIGQFLIRHRASAALANLLVNATAEGMYLSMHVRSCVRTNTNSVHHVPTSVYVPTTGNGIWARLLALLPRAFEP